MTHAREIKTYSDLVDFYHPDLIRNNSVINHFVFDIVSGCDYNEDTDSYTEFYKYYIIDSSFAETLENMCPNEVVFYNEDIDMYLWGIPFGGLSWEDVPIETIYNS